MKARMMKEDAVYGKHNPKATLYDYKTTLPTSIHLFNVEHGLHPTQKPLPLFEYLIKTYSNEGDVVLDNCIGSGTTAVACKRLNRKFIGFEVDKNYYDISLKRLLNVPERLDKWIES